VRPGSGNHSVSLAPIGFAGLVALALLGLAGCATRPKPPQTDYGEIRAKVKTVALAPVRSATVVVKVDQADAAFTERATLQLRAAGLTVLDPSVWDGLWRRYAEDVGGVYDVSTGEADEQKHATVRDAVVRELVEVHHVDAILYLAVRVAEHFGVSQLPQVCGEYVPPYWPGGWASRSGKPATIVRSTCLVGVLVDPNDEELFARQSGLEGIETYDAQTRAIRPEAEVFQDAEMLDRAVVSVLEAFPPLAVPPAAAAAKGADSGAGTTSADGAAPAEARAPSGDAAPTASD